MCTESEGAERFLQHQLFTPEHKLSGYSFPLWKQPEDTWLVSSAAGLHLFSSADKPISTVSGNRWRHSCLFSFTRHYKLIYAKLASGYFHYRSWLFNIQCIFIFYLFIFLHCCNTITCTAANSWRENDCSNHPLSWRHEPVQ